MRKTRYTKKFLEPIVQASQSWAQVIRACNLKTTGGNHRAIQKWVRYRDIDTSHFKGQGWCRGETKETDERVARIARLNSRPFSEMLIENAPPTVSSSRLREAFITITETEECCDNCGIIDWLRQPLKLHLDHINGISNDNRIENLRFLCPNCHQQTPTWGNKK